MKFLSLILALVLALWWGAFLVTSIPQLDVLACVMLPEQSISGTLWFQVVWPTAMVTLSAVSLTLTLLIKTPPKAVLSLPFVPLLCLPAYYALTTGLSITQAALDACKP